MKARGNAAADRHDADAREVLGSFIAVGVTLGGCSLGDPEPEEDHGGSRYVGDVVEGISEQRHRVGQQEDRELQPGRDTKHGESDRHRLDTLV